MTIRRHHSNFVTYSNSCQEDFDIVLMSFALHHLDEPSKAGLLKQAQRLLSKRYLPDLSQFLTYSLWFIQRQLHHVQFLWASQCCRSTCSNIFLMHAPVLPCWLS